MSLISMTGFGAAPCTLMGRPYSVQVKSVNHRFLDIKFFLPHFCDPFEGELSALIKQTLLRGHVEVSVRLQNTATSAVQTISVDQTAAKELHRSLRSLQQELALPDPPTLQLIASFKEIFSFSEPSVSLENVKENLLQATQEALRAMFVMREREGAALQSELQTHATRAQELTIEISQRAPEAILARQQKSAQKIKALAQELSKTVDEESLASRVAIELASLADKADIAEELARLRSHFEQIKAAIQGPRPHGKKLDFLIQEMNREANTIGSKSQDVELSRFTVELKTEIERIREQIQNIE